jgi:hypothetical protein
VHELDTSRVVKLQCRRTLSDLTFPVWSDLSRAADRLELTRIRNRVFGLVILQLVVSALSWWAA